MVTVDLLIPSQVPIKDEPKEEEEAKSQDPKEKAADPTPGTSGRQSVQAADSDVSDDSLNLHLSSSSSLLLSWQPSGPSGPPADPADPTFGFIPGRPEVTTLQLAQQMLVSSSSSSKSSRQTGNPAQESGEDSSSSESESSDDETGAKEGGGKKKKFCHKTTKKYYKQKYTVSISYCQLL